MRYKPKSLAERGLKDVLGDQYDLFMEHVEIANRRKLAELLGWNQSKLYRRIRLYKKEKENASPKN